MSDRYGIIGYCSYLPRYRIKVGDIAEAWGKEGDSVVQSLKVLEKSVPGIDEDTATISVQAAREAIKSAGIAASEIGALYIGSESHPYVIKPTGTIVAQAIGATPNLTVADLEFACKAGTAGMQMCLSHVKAGFAKYAMAIGADTAQGRPADALEYTAAAGGAAYILGKDPIAEILHTCSYTTDTPDFWRREGEKYPSHGARFTGEPAYFKHVLGATNLLFERTGFKADDFDHVIFHMPNAKFPLAAASRLGIKAEKMKLGLVVTEIGNTYSGSSMLGLARVLDNAKPGEKILMTSFGSGAGSDSFAIEVTEKIERIKRPTPLQDYIDKKIYLNYSQYLKHRKKIKM